MKKRLLSVWIMLVSLSWFAPNSFGQEPIRPTATPDNPQLIQQIDAWIADPDCKLPCFWGRELGVDSLMEFESHIRTSSGMEPFGRPISPNESPDVVTFSIPIADVGIYDDVAYLWLGFWSESFQTEVLGVTLKVDTWGYVDDSPYSPAGIPPSPHFLKTFV